MTEEKKCVLIVDDSADDLHILMENLKQDYAVLAATSGEKALALATRDPQPDVILLDVMMPDIDGYETCRQLKANPDTSDLDVIFISAHDTTEEKLAGYNAGGSDYLIKPVQPSELLQKVKLAIKNKQAHSEVLAGQSMAMETAMTAMTSLGEQGVVLDFMRRSFAVSSIEELARLIVEVSSSYGLENTVQICGSREIIYASTHEPVSPLEQELLVRLKDAGRLREIKDDLVANFGAITQLILGMPEDEEKRGRLRDHIAVLLEGAEARLQVLEMDLELAQLVKDSNKALLHIGNMQKEQKQAAMQIMDNVVERMETSFFGMGLTEEQEQSLMSIVQEGVDRSLDNLDRGARIDDQLHAIVHRLENFLQN
ncbi:MAG TPA: response regulator [Gammaproteobacteria bacterium]|nr:response regulator [Gammaproteobacteria bacterium]